MITFLSMSNIGSQKVAGTRGEVVTQSLRRPLSLALMLTSGTLLLASCSSHSTPKATPSTADNLVSVNIGSSLLVPRQIIPLVVPSGLSSASVMAKVRHGQGALISFNSGVYDPSGSGDQSMILFTDNSFCQTVLPPAGTYSFENAALAGKDSTLVAYGLAGENRAEVSRTQASVQLKFHALYHPAASSLSFTENTATLYTNMNFNLGLFAKSLLVDGLRFPVPTSDLVIDAVPYTVT